MAARKPPMTTKLARTVYTRDGAKLRTRGDAATYMTGLPERRALYNAWQHAARLLLDGQRPGIANSLEFAAR